MSTKNLDGVVVIVLAVILFGYIAHEVRVEMKNLAEKIQRYSEVRNG